MLPVKSPASLVVPRGAALSQLPSRQAGWVGAQIVAAGLLAILGVWSAHPELALSATLGIGASSINTNKLWAIPLGTLLVLAGGLVCSALDLPAVIGAGAVAGVVATQLMPYRTDWLDLLHGALGALTGSSLGLWIATSLIPAATPPILTAILTAGMVGILGAQGLLPSAYRFDSGPDLPSAKQIKNSLKLRYRPPVLRATELYQAGQAFAPDRDTRRGLVEMVTWVYRLQLSRQTLDAEVDSIDPVSVRARIDSYAYPLDREDSLSRERAATVEHLRRLLVHREKIDLERRRTEALVDYALAFLEEARAGLAISRELPGEWAPERLDEVLERLRSHADRGTARRQSMRDFP